MTMSMLHVSFFTCYITKMIGDEYLHFLERNQDITCDKVGFTSSYLSRIMNVMTWFLVFIPQFIESYNKLTDLMSGINKSTSILVFGTVLNTLAFFSQTLNVVLDSRSGIQRRFYIAGFLGAFLFFLLCAAKGAASVINQIKTWSYVYKNNLLFLQLDKAPEFIFQRKTIPDYNESKVLPFLVFSMNHNPLGLKAGHFPITYGLLVTVRGRRNENYWSLYNSGTFCTDNQYCFDVFHSPPVFSS